MKNHSNISCSHLLKELELNQIHKLSLKILAEIGIKIEDNELVDELKSRGCIENNDRLLFPRSFINDILKEQDKFHKKKDYADLKFRNPLSGDEKSFKRGRLWSQPFGTVAKTLDLKTNHPRLVNENDLIEFIHLQNNLENIDFTGPSVIPDEYPAKLRELKMTETALRYSDKVFGGIAASRSQEIDYIIELYKIIQDNQLEPIGGIGISPESPLLYPKVITDIIRKVARAEIPIKVLVAPIAGMTAPLTIAGSLAQMNASMLAFTAITSIINPGTILFFCSRLSFPNMRKAYSIWGLPEIGLGSAGAVQLAKYYGFFSTVYGVSTTACNIDVQAGYEKALNALLPALAGANILSGAGSLASNTLASKGQLVVDNEIITLVKRIVSRYDVNKDTLGFEVIERAIEDGSFIADRHTVEHLKAGEVYHTQLGFDSFWYEWQEEGFPEIADKAENIIQEILAKKPEQLLSPEQDKAFSQVLSAAERNLL
ncbi:MAG: trimethylamine methyltransferase family protein [Bacillota bacterium]